METSGNDRRVIITIIVMILLALTIYVLSAKRSKANAAEVSIPQVEQKDATYEETIHAYNRVLHRVLLDKPSYFEDVLVETPEYIRLECLLFNEDLEEIYNITPEDSIVYELNRSYEISGEPNMFKSNYE